MLPISPFPMYAFALLPLNASSFRELHVGEKVLREAFFFLPGKTMRRKNLFAFLRQIAQLSHGKHEKLSHFWWKKGGGDDEISQKTFFSLWLLIVRQSCVIGIWNYDKVTRNSRATKDLPEAFHLKRWASRKIISRKQFIRCFNRQIFLLKNPSHRFVKTTKQNTKNLNPNSS